MLFIISLAIISSILTSLLSLLLTLSNDMTGIPNCLPTVIDFSKQKGCAMISFAFVSVNWWVNSSIVYNGLTVVLCAPVMAIEKKHVK